MEIDDIISSNTITAPQQDNSKINKDQFLQLLVTQMKYQDPLNPMGNEQMLAQLAQFSSLEQMSNLNDNLAQANTVSQFINSTQLIGKNVVISDPSSSPSNPTTITQKVKAVSLGENGSVLTLDNEMVVDANQIIRVEQPQENITQ